MHCLWKESTEFFNQFGRLFYMIGPEKILFVALEYENLMYLLI